MTPSRRAAALPAALLVVLLGACASRVDDRGGDGPRPAALSPAVGYSAVAEDLSIRGDGFALRAYQDGSGTPRLDAGFRAWVGGVELGQVSWASSVELRGKLPAGLAPGTHDLEVEDPYGRRAILRNAYRAAAGSPPRLSLTASLAPAVALVGQPLAATVVVRNEGGAEAQGVLPIFTQLGGGQATVDTPPAPTAIPAGESASFIVPMTAHAAGALHLLAAATGLDPVIGTSLATAEVDGGEVSIEAASALVAFAPPGPLTVNVTQQVSVTIQYVNAPGAAAVTGLRATVTSQSGQGALSVAALPAACDIPAGGGCDATFRLMGQAGGAVTVTFDASGTSIGGAKVPAPAVSVRFQVVAPAALSGRLVASPSQVAPGATIAVTLDVTNAGGAVASGVVPQLLSAPIGAEPGADPPPRDIAPGETVSFGWPVILHRAGRGAFTADADGVDANTGAPVHLSAVASGSVVVK